MMKTRFILILGFLTLLSFSNARAQVNPVYQRMVQNGWSYPFKNGFRKLTPEQAVTESNRSLGYDSTKVASLKGIGVDVVNRWKKHRWGQKMWAALSDCIVVGTVSKIEHPSWPRPWFHSVAYVKVEKFLRNDYDLPKGQVAVMEVTGPTGRKGQEVVDLSEDTLKVGEHVLLYLGASALITFAANNNMRALYEKLINDPEIRFQMLAKCDVKSGQIFLNGKKQNVDSVADSVKSVLNEINHSVPTNR